MPSSIQVAKQVLRATKQVLNGSGYGKREVFENEYGYKVLGSGQCSVAIVHPYDRNLVVKVITKSTDGGMDFAAWIVRKQMQGVYCKHLPEIHAFYTEDGATAIVMERLEPSGEHHNYMEPAQNREVAGWRTGDSNDPVMQEFFSIFGTPDDLHGQNWMKRGETPVLVDPTYRRAPTMEQWENYWREGKLHIHAGGSKYHAGYGPNDILPGIHEVKMPAELDMRLGLDKFRIPIPRMHRVVQKGENLQQVAKRDPFMGHHFIDFAKAEALIMEKMIMGARKAGMTMIGHDCFVQKKVVHDRTALVKDGSPAAIRAEKEDRMLRIRSKHDHQSRRKGILGALFQRPHPWRIPSARCTEPCRVGEAEGGIGNPALRGTGPPQGLHARYTDPLSIMAAKVWRHGGTPALLRHRLQPVC